MSLLETKEVPSSFPAKRQNQLYFQPYFVDKDCLWQEIASIWYVIDKPKGIYGERNMTFNKFPIGLKIQLILSFCWETSGNLLGLRQAHWGTYFVGKDSLWLEIPSIWYVMTNQRVYTEREIGHLISFQYFFWRFFYKNWLSAVAFCRHLQVPRESFLLLAAE